MSLNDMSHFQDSIKEWVSIDNNIKELNKQLKEYKQHRSTLVDNIITYANDNNIQHAEINISDGKLKFKNTKQVAPITLKYVKECLDHIINNEQTVETIMDYIKSNRGIKYVNDIKRYYK